LKPGILLPPDSQISLIASPKYVSRGGDKLEAALDFWGISVQNLTCLDIGASTGGVTDCLLQRGASKVYTVDVGRGQLDHKIRKDSRVLALEKTHVLKWKPDWKEGAPKFVTMDVSFMSVKNVFPWLKKNLPMPFAVLCLIKPQFEVLPQSAPRGIVKDESAREAAIQSVLEAAQREGFILKGCFPCPVLGAKGNREEWVLWGSDSQTETP
jgi:23S rRNA (cytidine1920-2'-O)/16S rRNA (cytidine1409-2'-O)-methyltransferase